MSEKRRSLEQCVITRMRLFAHWLEFWEEDVKDESGELIPMSSDFGLLQLDDLQKSLERLRAKIVKDSKN